MGDVLPHERRAPRPRISRRGCSCPQCDPRSNDEKMKAVFEGFIPVAANLRAGRKTPKK
jgi:hypothetical protein